MRDDLSVLLLGPMRLGPARVRGASNRVVLARLAATPGEPVPIHELIEALWGESFPVTAVKTLHSHVARLRRDLRAAGHDGLITTEESGYCLRIAPMCVDTKRFESLARQGRRHLAAGDFAKAIRTLGEATRLWRGVPFADCRRTPWVRRESDRLTTILVSLRENLITTRPDAQLLTELETAIHTSDPAIELAGRPAVAEEFPFVAGMRQDIEEVTWLLANDRMVTLTGVGGVGKSTLASQVARCNESSYPDGVWLVELEALNDPALVAHTVAEAMDLHDQSGNPMTSVVAEHLRSRVALLVLDNCEHLAYACASFVDTLLHAAPGLRILATSKQTLRVEGERVFDVKPLPVPDPGQYDAPAVAVFVRRADSALPDGFTLTEDNRADVISLCCRLEGIPLALELAAAQLRILALPELLARLDSMVRLRHTLRATVDWSYELCSPAERLLWRRVSVFADSFDIAAVENVCASYNDIPLDSVLDVINGLVDKSVLTRPAGPGPVRYRLQGTLRLYGREQLRRTGEEPLVRRRHRNWYLNIAEQREQQWFTAAQPEVSVHMRLDHANLRAALEFCLSEPGEAPAGVRLAGALWFHWVGNGILAEGQHWLDWALSATRQATADRWKALWVNGYLTALRGKTEAARQLLAQVGPDADDTSIAHATYVLGTAAIVDGDLAQGAEYLEEALERYRNLEEPNTNVIMARVALAVTAAFHGDLPRAEEVCREAHQICAVTGEKWARAYVLLVLAVLSAMRGDQDAAADLARESLRLKDSTRDLLGISAAIELLAITAEDPGRVAALLGAAQRMWPRIGARPAGLSRVNATHLRCIELARQALGDSAFEAAFNQGACLSPPAAVSYACSG